MPATARLVVMMEPGDKRQLETQAREAHLSLAEVVRRRLVAPNDPEQEAFLDALVELGKKAEQVFADADAMAARAAADDAAHRKHIRAAREQVAAAFTHWQPSDRTRPFATRSQGRVTGSAKRSA